MSNLEIAQKHWGQALPEWAKLMANDCDQRSQTAVGTRLGYSSSVISQVLKNAYPGDMKTFGEKAAGIYLAETVNCPVVGEITRDRCHREQSNEGRTSSSVRNRLYHACRSGTCPSAKRRAS